MLTSMTLTLLVLFVIWLLVHGQAAAPSPTARVDPTSATVIKLKDGYKSLITFAADTNIEFWEKTVQPPGYAGGGGIPQTTMFNNQLHTMAPHSLIKVKDGKVKAAYDPVVMNSIRSLINVETTITIRWADGSTLAYYGFLDDAEFDPLEEGKQPEVTLTIVATNWDPTNKVEEGPVFTGVTGT